MSEYLDLLNEKLIKEASARQFFEQTTAMLRGTCKHENISDWMIGDIEYPFTRFVKLCLNCHKEMESEDRPGTGWILKDGKWELLLWI